MRATLIAVLALFIATSPLSIECVACTVVVDESTLWERLAETVEMIRNDPKAASLEAVDWWCGPLDTLRSPPEGLEHEADEMRAFLTSFARTSTDDWLVDRIAYSLAQCVEEAWSPLFRDLLEHPSLQIRWRAVQHFAYIEDPEAVPDLDSLWNDALPAWIRTDLADALLHNESEEHAEDCVDLVDTKDLALARAALRTVGELRPPGALEAINRHAEQIDSPLREEAVSALAGWPDDQASVRLLVDLSRSEVGAVKDAALAALSDSSQPGAINRLVEVASNPTAVVSRRLGAMRAITHSDHPDLIRVLSEILEEPITDNTILLQRHALDGLSMLGVDVGVPDALTGEFTTTVVLSYSDSSDPVMAIRQPIDGDSVRCWAAPHIETDPEDYDRLVAGLPVDLADHFQSGDEHWVRVDDEECWIPFDQLDEAIGDWEENPDWPYRHEFDVRLEELASPMGEALLAAGMIRIFDVGDTVAAVEFGIDPEDRQAVGQLVELYVDDDSELSYSVWAALDELAGWIGPDSQLGRTIARARGE